MSIFFSLLLKRRKLKQILICLYHGSELRTQTDIKCTWRASMKGWFALLDCICGWVNLYLVILCCS